MLNQAEAAKALAEAGKTAGVYRDWETEIEWQEIENRIQESREQIAASNIIEAKANAQKAMEEFNQAMLNQNKKRDKRCNNRKYDKKCNKLRSSNSTRNCKNKRNKEKPIVTGKQIGRAHV